MLNNLQSAPPQVLPSSQACRPIACQAIISADKDAAEIGDLYCKARLSLVESIQFAFICGQRLIEKKASLLHGAWLPWLRDNADVLRFETPRTAQRLMAFAANTTLSAHLDEAEALAYSRQLWGKEAVATDKFPVSTAVSTAVNGQYIVPKRSKQHQADIDRFFERGYAGNAEVAWLHRDGGAP